MSNSYEVGANITKHTVVCFPNHQEDVHIVDRWEKHFLENSFFYVRRVMLIS